MPPAPNIAQRIADELGVRPQQVTAAVHLLDVGSSNGTYLRLRAPRSLRNGDFLLLGQQLFRVQTV